MKNEKPQSSLRTIKNNQDFVNELEGILSFMKTMKTITPSYFPTIRNITELVRKHKAIIVELEDEKKDTSTT